MTKLRIISDTHFDEGLNGLNYGKRGVQHTPFGSYFGKALKKEKADITLIAGDLASSIQNTDLFLNGFFPDEKVIFTGGNHLLYTKTEKTIYELIADYKEAFPKTHLLYNFLENDWMFIPGTDNKVAIIGSIFYTDYQYKIFKSADDYNQYQHAMDVWASAYGLKPYFKPVKRLTKKVIFNENILQAKYGLNDFRWGWEKKGVHITPYTYLKLHNLAKEKVESCYKEILSINPECKIILMTHHGLSGRCIDGTYAKSRVNASYVSDLEDWINTMPNIRLVISGHVHCRKDFIFGKNKTRYIVNACGYIPRNEPFKDIKFNPNLIIDIDDL